MTVEKPVALNPAPMKKNVRNGKKCLQNQTYLHTKAKLQRLVLYTLYKKRQIFLGDVIHIF